MNEPDRVDDPSIGDEERLWRRIKPTSILVVTGADGQPRPSSAAFLDNDTGELSVHRASLTTEEQVLKRYPDVALAGIQAKLPRSLGHRVVADPIPATDTEPGDPSHALICPPTKRSKSGRKSDPRRMADQAIWVVPPPTPTAD